MTDELQSVYIGSGLDARCPSDDKFLAQALTGTVILKCRYCKKRYKFIAQQAIEPSA